jgi:two-component system phosphate regulon sensor histidine kinase PhoR
MKQLRFWTALSIVLAVLCVAGAAFFSLPGWAAVFGPALSGGLVIGLWLGTRHRENHNSTELIRSNQEPDELTTNFAPKLLDVAINEMREGLVVINAEMRIVASNRAARNLFSNVDGAIDSRRLTELTRNPSIYDAFLDAVHGKERGGVKVETYQDGRRVFDLRVVPLRSTSSAEILGAVGVLFDITRLERLEVVRQEFLSNVSHELRTPLTSIMALAETLEAGAINDANNSRRFLAIIQKNAARMQHLIEDILELSAIEAGNVSVNAESIHLKSLVEDIVNSLAAAAADRNVSLRNLVPSDAQVFADPHRLMQMLTNLIDNAIKFNRDGGTVTVEYERDDRDRISIADTGEGIATQHLDRLFERFYRVDRARSQELGGTGLGLAIVKHLAKAHGGEVSVYSRVGEGTQFTIDLPRNYAVSATELSATAVGSN